MKTAPLFIDGTYQAVRLPEEFRFEGEKVYIRKIGNVVVLLPEKDSWKPMFDSLEQFSDDYMEERICLLRPMRKV